jgi:hypothetical protein
MLREAARAAGRGDAPATEPQTSTSRSREAGRQLVGILDKGVIIVSRHPWVLAGCLLLVGLALLI